MATVAVAAVSLVALGCTGEPTTSAAPATTPTSSGSSDASGSGADLGPSTGADAEPTSDEMTPLIVTATDEPVPVKGTDDRYHVAYELQVVNYAPRVATITAIDTVDAATGEVVATLDADEIVARSLLVGSAAVEPTDVPPIPAGGTIIVLVDDRYDTEDEIPEVVEHRIAATFAPAAADQAPYADAIFPDEIVQTTGPLHLGAGEPLRISSPVQGDNWAAINACCDKNSHRSAVLPMAGRVNGTERYALDWIQVDPDRWVEVLRDGQLASFEGDATRNESYLAYDEPLLAVADGTVVAVVDGVGDEAPHEATPGLPLDQLGGNSIIIDLGDGFFAFYGHVKRGSFTVAVGDEVRRGQEVGRLGNSGNTTEAHLHFHVMRGPTPLAATNWPFVIDGLVYDGLLTETAVVPEPEPGPRRDVLPLASSLTSFPVGEG